MNVKEARLFPDKYRKYLREYIFKGGDEAVLLNAYDELLNLIDPYSVEVVTILDIHVRALEEIFDIHHDNDMIQWVYVQRANEFLA